ncbi:hypothetical protein AgCh_009088 [Apium graveolens]
MAQQQEQFQQQQQQFLQQQQQHQQFIQEQHQQIQQQQLQLQQQHQQRELNQTASFKSFHSVKPPKFKGEVDPVFARIWVKEMEKAFTLIQNQLEIEFLELKQGEKSVSKFEAKFTELARLASGYVALVIESDQKLAVKEKGDKKRKSESVTDKANQEESSQKFQRKAITRQSIFQGGIVSQGPATSTSRVGIFKMTKRSDARDSDVVAADLIPFQLGEFDVILGMDWLSQHKANIDCKKRKIAMHTKNNVRINYQGQKQEKKFLSLLEAKKLLGQGCKAYLAHIIDTEKEAPNLDEIPIFREFPDVFPDELPGFPLDREIEFSIDLIHGAGPVSKAPYRMAPV